MNFITAHDGFTLHDVVAFNEKHNHNEAYGENNQYGSANNRSWNYGAEGLTEDQGILALRDRQMRNLMPRCCRLKAHRWYWRAMN